MSIILINFKGFNSGLFASAKFLIYFWSGRLVKFISVVLFELQIICVILMIIAKKMMFLFGIEVGSGKGYENLPIA